MTQVLAAIRLEMLEAREGAEAEVQRAQKLVLEAREGAEAEVQRAQAEVQRAQKLVAEVQLARDEAVANVRRETHTSYCKAKLKWEEQTQAAERSFAAALDEVRAQLGAEREASAAHADGQLSAVLDPLRAELEQVRCLPLIACDCL